MRPLMVSLVGRPYHRWFSAHSVRSVALTDAHEKADTLHRDVSLGNIILYRLKEKMERVGYLVDWELSRKPSKRTARDHVLTVRLMLLALNGGTDVFKGDSCFYVHQSAEYSGTCALSRGRLRVLHLRCPLCCSPMASGGVGRRSLLVDDRFLQCP